MNLILYCYFIYYFILHVSTFSCRFATVFYWFFEINTQNNRENLLQLKLDSASRCSLIFFKRI